MAGGILAVVAGGNDDDHPRLGRILDGRVQEGVVPRGAAQAHVGDADAQPTGVGSHVVEACDHAGVAAAGVVVQHLDRHQAGAGSHAADIDAGDSSDANLGSSRTGHMGAVAVLVVSVGAAGSKGLGISDIDI